MTYPSDPRQTPEPDGMSVATMAGIAVAIILFLGIIVWAFNTGDRQTASSPSPATTGQGTPPPKAPAPPEKAPAPAPKAQ
jgi:hypothetical protein